MPTRALILRSLRARSKFARSFALVAAPASLLTQIACSVTIPPTFFYDGMLYGTREDARAAAQYDVEVAGLLVPHVANSLAKSVVVQIPTRRAISERGILAWAQPDALRSSIGVTAPAGTTLQGADGADFVAEFLAIGVRAVAEGIGQSALFEATEVIESYKPEGLAGDGHDLVIWLALRNPSSAHWYIQSSSGGDRIAIPLDPDVNRHLRIADWIERVQKAALALGASESLTSPAGQSQSGSTTEPARPR